jgi:hypothetical protein
MKTRIGLAFDISPRIDAIRGDRDAGHYFLTDDVIEAMTLEAILKAAPRFLM